MVDGEKKTRLEIRQERETPILFPEVNFEYLLTCLTEIGFSTQSGMGQAPLSFTDVDNWSKITGANMESWELTLMVKLSQQYCFQQAISDDRNCEEPYIVEEIDDSALAATRAAVDDKIRNLF